MAKPNRPEGFVDCSKAMEVIDNSIASAKNWGELTNDAFGSSERIEQLEELLNLIVELHWRYGNSAVFKFTRKKVSGTINASDVLDDIPDCWTNRITLDEDPKQPKVYISF